MKIIRRLLNKERRSMAMRALMSDEIFIVDSQGATYKYHRLSVDTFARYISRMASKNYVESKKIYERNRRKK